MLNDRFSDKTKIEMADGSRKFICDLSVGEEIFGYDDGRIIKSQITKIYDNFISNDFVRIQINSNRGLYCNSEKLFFSKETNCFISAKDMLNKNVEFLDFYDELTDRQYHLMLGKILGDGSLCVSRNKGICDHNRKTAQIQWSHKIEHLDYIEWFSKALGTFSGNIIKTEIISGYGTEMKKAWSKVGYDLYTKFYNPETYFPKFEILSPISLAIFYMDDGNLSHNAKQRDRAVFSVCDYTESQCDRLIDIIKNSFGLVATKKFYDYWYLTFNSDNTEKLFSIIYQYIPVCMQYKLSPPFRNKFIPFCEDEKNHQNNRFKTFKVMNVDNKIPRKYKKIHYNLETEIGNFFANNILIYN